MYTKVGLDRTALRFVGQFDVPPHMNKRQNRGSSAEIVVAFLENGVPNADSCPIYAFLPVASVGFKFIIQADFDLTSSRRELHHNKWNAFLRDRVVRDLFVITDI